MLNIDQLSNQIAAYAAGRLSLNDFEDWFRDQSRNVHLWGDVALNEFVDAIEEAFSERHFEGLDEVGMRSKLQAEAERFARPFVSRHDSVGILVCESPRRLLAASAAAVLVLSIAPPNDMVFPPSQDGTLISTDTSVVGNPSKETDSVSVGLALRVVPA